MSANPFLADFMRTQARLIQTAANDPDPPKKDKKGRRKSKYGTAHGDHPFGESDPFEVLCNEKPHRREVVKYLRQKIAQLVAQEDF